MQVTYNTITITGNLKNTTINERLALIGSRSLSQRSLDFTKYLGYEMVKAGKTVVSGLALGADTSAIMGAIQAINDGYSGTVIALAPTIPYEVYPKSNKLLYDLVKKYGMLVYPYDRAVLRNPSYIRLKGAPYIRFIEQPLLVDRSVLNGQICSEVHVVADYPYVKGGSQYAPSCAMKENKLCFNWHMNPSGKFFRDDIVFYKKPSIPKPIYPTLKDDLNYILEHLV